VVIDVNFNSITSQYDKKRYAAIFERIKKGVKKKD
tara:strand:- start:695 stop:799 length:105 start_codon:yes stop_codon:yes gene_type:complete